MPDRFTSRRMYDEFESHGTRGGVGRAVLAVAVFTVVVGAAGAAFVVTRSHRGGSDAAPASRQASLATRCTASFDHDYAKRAPATIGPRALHVLVPRVCAAGIAKGLVRADGTMRDEDSYKVTTQVINELGPARVQTMMWNELAVTPYKLAAPGKVTRRDRCLVMGYSAYDELSSRQRGGYPQRPTFFAAVRYACDLGIKRHLVPPSGAPSRAVTAALLAAGLAYVAQHNRFG